MSYSLPQRLAAESLGTGLLVATVVGSGIMAERLLEGAGLALLANTIATGAILFVLIAALGGVSGAHFNPVVSMIFAIRREIEWSAAGWFAIAQLAGGVAGSCSRMRCSSSPCCSFRTVGEPDLPNGFRKGSPPSR